MPSDLTLLNTPRDPAPWAHTRFNTIPGTDPVDTDGWLQTSETYAGQMAERRRLVSERPDDVIASTPGSEAAQDELCEAVLAILQQRAGYRVTRTHVHCPDGLSVAREGPVLPFLARIVQEDLCLMQERGADYALTAAALCFPMGWTLSEKLGRGMTSIHIPVDSYDAQAAKRVNRLFQGLQVGRPIVRWNGVFKPVPQLYLPEREDAYPRLSMQGSPRYYRSERQCLTRLPRTRAIVFSIHTYVWQLTDLPIQPPTVS